MAYKVDCSIVPGSEEFFMKSRRHYDVNCKDNGCKEEIPLTPAPLQELIGQGVITAEQYNNARSGLVREKIGEYGGEIFSVDGKRNSKIYLGQLTSFPAVINAGYVKTGINVDNLMFSNLEKNRLHYRWGSSETQAFYRANVQCEEVDKLPAKLTEINIVDFMEAGAILLYLAEQDGDWGNIGKKDIDTFGVKPWASVWLQRDYEGSTIECGYKCMGPLYRMRAKKVVGRILGHLGSFEPNVFGVESEDSVVGLLVNGDETVAFSKYVIFDNLNIFLNIYSKLYAEFGEDLPHYFSSIVFISTDKARSYEEIKVMPHGRIERNYFLL